MEVPPERLWRNNKSSSKIASFTREIEPFLTKKGDKAGMYFIFTRFMFAELKALYKLDDEKPSSGVAVPLKMSAGLISITLMCVGASMGERQPLVKKLPPSTTVGRLKVLCESFFKLKGVKLRLFLQEKESPFPTLLDDDTAPLMNIATGTEPTVLVDQEN